MIVTDRMATEIDRSSPATLQKWWGQIIPTAASVSKFAEWGQSAVVFPPPETSPGRQLVKTRNEKNPAKSGVVYTTGIDWRAQSEP
jgi:hypothetical protein